MPRTYTIPIRSKITLDITGFPDEKTDALEDFFDNSFHAGEWEFYYDLNGDIKAVFTEDGTETVIEECLTLPNGDPGYPEEREHDLMVYPEIIEEYFEAFCRKNGLQDVEYSIVDEINEKGV